MDKMLTQKKKMDPKQTTSSRGRERERVNGKIGQSKTTKQQEAQQTSPKNNSCL